MSSLQLTEIAEVEEQEAHRCKVRLEHLIKIGQPQKNHALEWNHKRMDRILVDHMLRSGFLESASQLASSAQIEVKSAMISYHLISSDVSWQTS